MLNAAKSSESLRKKGRGQRGKKDGEFRKEARERRRKGEKGRDEESREEGA